MASNGSRRARLTADGPKLRGLREDAWLNQDELAEKAGVAPHTIMRIEKGHTPHPNRPTLRKIAKALGVSPNELVKEPPDPLGHFNFFRPLLGVG